MTSNSQTNPSNRSELVERAMVHVVFDGPPSHESGRFVECETPDGRSINAGEWHERDDGLWELRIPIATTQAASPDVERVARAIEDNIWLQHGKNIDFDLAARAAIAAIRGGSA